MLIESLAAAGVTALKIEGRQRSRAYVRQVIRNFRRMVDNYAVGLPMPAPILQSLSEGQATTEGAYRKKWR
jgi:collagenase-like PrtC family protease